MKIENIFTARFDKRENHYWGLTSRITLFAQNIFCS